MDRHLSARARDAAADPEDAGARMAATMMLSKRPEHPDVQAARMLRAKRVRMFVAMGTNTAIDEAFGLLMEIGDEARRSYRSEMEGREEHWKCRRIVARAVRAAVEGDRYTALVSWHHNGGVLAAAAPDGRCTYYWRSGGRLNDARLILAEFVAGPLGRAAVNGRLRRATREDAVRRLVEDASS